MISIQCSGRFGLGRSDRGIDRGMWEVKAEEGNEGNKSKLNIVYRMIVHECKFDCVFQKARCRHCFQPES